MASSDATAAEHARTTRALLHAPDSEWDAMQLNGCDVLNNFMQQTESITSSLSASLPPLCGGGAGIAGGLAEGGESKADAPASGLLPPADCCGSTAEGSETCPDCGHVRVTTRTPQPTTHAGSRWFVPHATFGTWSDTDVCSRS